MARFNRPLTEDEARAFTKPGRYSMGGKENLQLYVHSDGRRSWQMRTAMNDERITVTLAEFSQMTLAEARVAARQYRDGLAEVQATRHRDRVDEALESIEDDGYAGDAVALMKDGRLIGVAFVHVTLPEVLPAEYGIQAKDVLQMLRSETREGVLNVPSAVLE